MDYTDCISKPFGPYLPPHPAKKKRKKKSKWTYLFQRSVRIGSQTPNVVVQCSVPGFSSALKKSVNKIAYQQNDRAEIFGNKAKDQKAGENSAVLGDESYDPIRPLSHYVLLAAAKGMKREGNSLLPLAK